MATDKLRVAICGGGIASLCLAHALAKYPHLDVKIFEKSTVLRDEGASVGLGPNALDALTQLSTELREAVDEAGGVAMDPMLRIMFTETGQHVHDVRLKDKTQNVVYWGALFRALYKRIPTDAMILGKGAASVDDIKDSGALRVNFDDGTSYEADAVVGCDGINSIIRTAVLGANHPALQAVYSDRYNHRVVIPVEAARKVFGEEYCSVGTQCGWVGEEHFLLTDLADNGASMQVIADFKLEQPWPYPSPFVEWSKEKMHEELGKCGDMGKLVAKVYSDQPKLYAACMRRHLDTPTFSKGNMCIAGDAALAFLPFHGAGAGQAIEDALILSTVIGACSKTTDIARAFKSYDQIRRPRRTHVAHASDDAGLLLTGKDPEVGLDPDRFAAKVGRWGSSIYGYDCAAAQREALALML